MITGTHSCMYWISIGDWKVSDKSFLFDLICLNDVVGDLECKTIPHNDIGYKYLHRPEYIIDSKQYYDCDISFPGIAVEGAENPYGRKYRIIDGVHRIIKTQVLRGVQIPAVANDVESKFYVMPADLFYKLILDQHGYSRDISDLGIYKCIPIS